MITLEGPEKCNNCGCNLYEQCGDYEGDDLSNKMIMSKDGEYEIFATTDDGEHVNLDIHNPEYFEVSPSHLTVKIPLDKWVYLTECFLEKHKRHIAVDKKQMELEL